MKVSKSELVKAFQLASMGLSGTEILEQSDCFVFRDGKLISFSGEVLVCLDSPVDIDNAVIPAKDILKLLPKFPDEEVEVICRENEFVIKGKGRTIGVPCHSEIYLPFESVPEPDTWFELDPSIGKSLWYAVRVCRQDETQPRVSCVHITSDSIEACDGFRLFRRNGATGFPGEVLVPAKSLEGLLEYSLSRASMADEGGWCYFQLDNGAQISLHCLTSEYYSENQIDSVLDMEGGEQVELPSELSDIAERARVMAGDEGASYNALIGVSISDNTLMVTSRKLTGWYRERVRVNHSGKPLSFEVNPELLIETLKHTQQVAIAPGKMGIELDTNQFLVMVLQVPESELAEV